MTFGAPLFLLAILAGAIPVLLHMINRQNAPVLHFSTLRFLRLSVQETRRRRYIHDLLLLLLRVGALVLIALALAQPAVYRLHQWLAGRSSTDVALIVDNSASLASADQNGLRWERVTDATEQILDQLQQGDQVALLVTNGTPLLPSRGLYKNHEIVRQALATCRPSFERADLAAALQEAQRLLAKSKAPNKEIYIVTDMQATCWRDAKPRPAKSDDQPPIVIANVSGPHLPNASLSRIAVEATAPVAGVPLRATSEVQGDAQVAEERRIELYIDNRKVGTSPTLNIEPGQLARHTFQLTLQEQGLHRGDVRLDGDDACPADDRLYFAANTNPAVPVAIVKAAEHDIRYLDQAYYLQRALSPSGDQQGAILVRSLTPAELPREPLSQFVVVFCVDLPTPTRAVADLLVAYVESGGNLVWICGDNVDPVGYSALHEQVDQKLLPVRLTGVQQAGEERPDGWHIAWLDPEDPVLAPFVEPASVHQSVLVYQYVQMPPTENSSVRVLARLDDGQPLLVNRNVGSGEVFLLATSMHKDWTNFPLRPLFLPFVSRLTFQLAGTNANQPLVIAGTPWTLPVAAGEAVNVEIAKPDGNVVRIDRRADPNGPVRFQQTHQVGIYDVRIHRGPRTQHTAFAVNPDPEESAPLQIRKEDLLARLAPSTVVFCDDVANMAETIQKLREGQSLWELFLVIVLLALVGEAFLANRRALNPERLQQQSPIRNLPRSGRAHPEAIEVPTA